MDTQIGTVIEAYEKKIEIIERERPTIVEKMQKTSNVSTALTDFSNYGIS